MKIMLDAGHGGTWPKGEPGSVANTGQREDRTNMNVVLYLVDMLKAEGHTVILTRSKHDEVVTIAQRQALIKKHRPDLLISVHHNANIKGAKGATACIQIKNTKATYDDVSKKLAENMMIEFAKLGQNIRPLTQKVNSKGNADYFGLLRTAAYYKIPAVITEFAFMSPEDVVDIDTYTEQKKEAAAIAAAVKKTFG